MNNEFERRLYVHVIMMILEKKNWKFEYENGETYFILGNREISTQNMTILELDELLTQIVNW